MYILYIQPDSSAVAAYTSAAEAYMAKPYGERDAGFDLFCAPHNFTDSSRVMLSQQMRAAVFDTERNIFRAYWMLPRSSISKTGLRLANSVGLIDAGYRGPIMAAVNYHAFTGLPTEFAVNMHDRYFQLSAPDLLPWDGIRIVETLPGGATLRGEGGFGSTGLGTVA